MSVVLGVAFGTPFLPRDDINVAQARNNFIQEYNRLAALAAAAPDIHIIMGTRQLPHQAVNNVPAGHLAGHLAGHMAGHRAVHVPAPVINPTPTFVPSGPIMTWPGPFADDIPAGLGGFVQDTDDVAAAKAAHYQALAAAPKNTHF
ncbi:unnamed protein product [Meganyctiphanes norvegica]|uniref:Uncharacterized protein n=1 Tax=Meganyctiphanes norvegica TaxID=48144 RepID=A0AAV2SGF0_MEGNR